MKKSVFVPALIGALALSMSACAQAPSSSSSASGSSGASASASNFKGCMVSDMGGFDDKSFNQTSLAGLTKAVQDLGIQEGKVQSASDADYAKNVQSMVDAKCNIIVGVGFKLTDAIVAAAKANPDIKFAIVDDSPKEPQPNVKGILFQTSESSFLAGYLAASQSQSGKVGTFGGMKIPSVTIFMDGFAQGIDYYNQQKGKSVQLLGWDITKQDGQFVQSQNPFTDVAAGKTTATNLTSQGADILFPVAGGAGVGALQVAQESGGKVNSIWVDTDGCVSAAQYCSVLMTSVYKAMDVAVYDVIKSAMDGNFSNENFVGTLKNNGTGISPYHDFSSKIDSATQAEIDKIKAGIIDGSIKVSSVSAVK